MEQDVVEGEGRTKGNLEMASQSCVVAETRWGWGGAKARGWGLVMKVQLGKPVVFFSSFQLPPFQFSCG